jgi:hypothetical protein
LVLYFDKLPSSGSCELYNLLGERVAAVDFHHQNALLLKTDSLAPGIYLARIKVNYSDGSSKQLIQKVAIIR